MPNTFNARSIPTPAMLSCYSIPRTPTQTTILQAALCSLPKCRQQIQVKMQQSTPSLMHQSLLKRRKENAGRSNYRLFPMSNCSVCRGALLVIARSLEMLENTRCNIRKCRNREVNRNAMERKTPKSGLATSMRLENANANAAQPLFPVSIPSCPSSLDRESSGLEAW